MLLALAVITVIMSMIGAEGIEGATLSGVVTAPVTGFTESLPICLFVMILGGFLGVVTETGALDTGIAVLVKKLHGNELILIPILMFIFSVGGTTYGMLEETVPFYLLLAATMYAAGFDSIVGAAVVLLGAGCGTLGSTVNPFAVGAAVDSLSSTGIAVNQGIVIVLGLILWLVSLAISIAFVMRYAKKVKANKGSTILSLQEQEAAQEAFGNSDEESEDAPAPKLTGHQKAALIAFAFTFVVMIVSFIPWEDFGVDVFTIGAESQEITATVSSDEIVATYDDATGSSLSLDTPTDGVAVSDEQISAGWSSVLTGVPLGEWYFDEASTWFLLMAILIGIIGGLSQDRFIKAFVSGCGDMMSVVLIIALARSITVLMGETGLSTWILETAASALSGMSAVVFAPLSYLLYILLSFLIPSSSGMATASMPIMGSLANQLGFSVETMIVIFSAGNGLVNLFTPTCGAIMGGLAIAKVEYSTWLKFGAKLFVILGIVSMVVLTIAMVVL
jgi:uncharacterized ion transporter superfamily protein YfcC